MKRFARSKRVALGLLVFLYVGLQSKVSAQCVFNCVDTINVSVNNLCTATITPNMVLKGFDPTASCIYGIELRDEAGNLVNLDLSRADIGPQFVGRFLTVRVFEPGLNVPNANSCWSVVKVEDKLPPDIICLGNDTLPCFDDIFSSEERAIEYLENEIENGLVDNCGNESVTINIIKNELTRMICTDTIAAIRVVGYNVLDNANNVTSCEDTIFYESFILDSIDAPKNFVDDMALDCNDPYPTIEYLLSIDQEAPGLNSMPNIDGVSIADFRDSLFFERGLCNFKMTTSDLEFPTCGNTFKVVRRWTVIDWCNANNLKVFNQVIKVEDRDLTLSAISNLGPFEADRGICTRAVELPFPSVASDECSDWTYVISLQEPGSVDFVQLGGVRDSVPQIVSHVFNLGITTVRYEATDACGNTDVEEFDVTVQDMEPPVPVCDSRTVVTLNDSFLGKVFARSFDDGSYDACSSIVSYEVRRMDRATSGCDSPQDFDEFVKFCCEDIGQSIMVELRVTDEAGMTATCMAEAVVQFKGEGPSVICAAGISTQACTSFETFDINTLTPPTITSSNPCIANALTPSIREAGRTIDDCGDGYIDIEWFYNLTGEDEVICTERIVFANTDIFTESNITWPADRVVDTCDEVPPTQQELDALITAVPGCSNVVPSEPSDREIENVPNVCRRIIRTWTVVDWCRFPQDPNARFVFDQIIDVVNSSGPVIDVSGSNISLDPKPDSCRAHIIIEGVATDDCSVASNIDWSHRLDLIRDGQEIPLLFERPGRILERRIDAGNFVVTWTATDECGNTSTARQLFTIEDEDPPTALCGFAVRELDSNGSAVVTAAELNNGSTDNCGDDLQFTLRREGSSSPLAPQLTFNCADVGVQTVELWVTDSFGNQDVCVASVDIRDSGSACQTGSSAISLSGNIMTIDNVTVESAEVVLADQNTAIASEMTELDGVYAFDNLSSDELYELQAHKDDAHINGVSTLDIILIQRHILGLQRLDSPYKLVAADVNVNGSVSAVDLVILRRLILGLITELPDTESWKFLAADYSFADPLYPWPIEEGALVGQINHTSTQDLIAIKMGDINGNAVANSGFASSRSTLDFHVSTRSSINNGHLTYEIIANESIESPGLQLAVNYDHESLRTSGVKSNHMLIVDDMLSDRDGKLAISLAGAHPFSYEEGDVILEVTFALSASTPYQEDFVQIASSEEFSNEIYDDELKIWNIRTTSAQVGDEIVLYQNRPNPFDDETLIDFEIPKADEVTLELFDMNGMRVFSRSGSYPAGKHQLKVSSQEIGLNKGIYYYQIHTQQRSLIRKMIIL